MDLKCDGEIPLVSWFLEAFAFTCTLYRYSAEEAARAQTENKR